MKGANTLEQTSIFRKKGWETRRKNYTPEQISAMAKKNGTEGRQKKERVLYIVRWSDASIESGNINKAFFSTCKNEVEEKINELLADIKKYTGSSGYCDMWMDIPFPHFIETRYEGLKHFVAKMNTVFK